MPKHRSRDVQNSGLLMKKKCPKEYKYIPGKIDFDCPLKKLYNLVLCYNCCTVYII